LSDFALRFGLALIVVTVASAAILISRRNYAKSADFERSIGTLRIEFGRLIDDAQAATIKSIAKIIRDNIFSVTKPIDSTVKDLGLRLARLEQQHTDAVAANTAGTQILDVRLARLEEHGDASGIQNLDVRLTRLEERDDVAASRDLDSRLAKLEERDDAAVSRGLDGRLAKLEERDDAAAIQNLDGRHARLEERVDASATQMAEAQKQSLEANARIVAQLAALEQSLTALSDQVSLVKQTVDGAAVREQDINNSIEAINSRIADCQTRVDGLFPRLTLGEKAHKDLGILISLCVNRIKKVNVNATEIARRLGDLESAFRSSAKPFEESAVLERKNGQSTGEIEKPIEDGTPKAAEAAVPIAAAAEGKNGGEGSPSPAKESANEASAKGEDRSDSNRAEQHAT
jgi:chromosome segregation ATPase